MSKSKIWHSDSLKIIGLFFIWKIILFFAFLFAFSFIPLGNTDKFLGGGNILYRIIPELFAWANFDGEHYLSISIFGYKGLEQAFFPVFPILISFFAKPFAHTFTESLIYSTAFGLVISNISFFLSLIVLYKLILLDFPKKIAYLTLLILILFPLSFYFGSLYNESLFLLLSLLSFYNARKKKWFLVAFFGMIASATRVFGFLLFFAYLVEITQDKEDIKKWFWILFIPLGLVFYMIYLYISVGDPIAFYTMQEGVGEQHQRGIILLPQVYYRYIKMLLSVSLQNPIYQTIVLEFVVGILFFLLPIIGYFKKVRLSYIFYSMVGFMLPSIQGSFSSAPRYILVFFPSFLILALLINSSPKLLKVFILTTFVIFLFLETALFLRGYWVA